MAKRAHEDDGIRYELVSDTDRDDSVESPLHLLRRVYRGRYGRALVRLRHLLLDEGL